MMVDCFIVGHFQENKMEYFKQKGLYRVIGLEHIFNPKLALISSCLDRYGARFEFMDATFDRIDQLPNMIASSNASIVAISTSETTSVLQASKLVDVYKRQLCISSMAAVLGRIGLGGYTAANAFMDAFVQEHNQKSKYQWTSVNLDTWLTDQTTQPFYGGIPAEEGLSLIHI